MNNDISQSSESLVLELGKRFWGLLILILALVAALVLTAIRPEPDTRPLNKPILSVSGEVYVLADARDLVIATGTVSSRWNTSIAAEVSGKVTHVSDALLSGAEFSKGDVLVQIEASEYELVLADATSALASAELALMHEEEESRLAAQEWDASGLDGEPSKLAIRTPQVSLSQQAVKAAKARVKRAQYQLAAATVRAPFDGVVVERGIDLGEVVQIGQEIAQVLDPLHLEVAVPLSAQEFRRLTHHQRGQEVMMTDSWSESTWSGTVSRVDQHIDTNNRWRSLVIDATGSTGLVPGTFVEVVLPGSMVEAALTVPNEFVSSEGMLWHVNSEGLLEKLDAKLVFQLEGRSTFKPISSAIDEFTLVRPTKGLLEGVRVSLIEDTLNDDELVSVSTAEFDPVQRAK